MLLTNTKTYVFGDIVRLSVVSGISAMWADDALWSDFQQLTAVHHWLVKNLYNLQTSVVYE